MNHKLFIAVIFFSSVFSGCNNSPKNRKAEKVEISVVTKNDSVKTLNTFPELKEGEFDMNETDFGNIVELNGKQIITNEVFRIQGTQMVVKDSLLLVKNLNTGNNLMVFSLPGFKLKKSFAKQGRGPGEFQFPELVRSSGGSNLCYLFDLANNNIYSVNFNFAISKLPFKLGEKSSKKMFSQKQVFCLSATDFLYVDSKKGGKAIYRFTYSPDSVRTEMIYDLSFSKTHKSWASYIGDFGVNKNKNRVVFAYKYFKRLIFADLKTGKTRVLNFQVKDAKKGDAISVMSPQNITHYWGMSAEENFVYVLYSGRAPVDVVKDGRKKNYYIYVEQFDWNGNPIKKYKLDKWGYFCVDEPRHKIYLASTYHAEPFFVYNLK